jgi:hypothetical protein
VRRFWFVLAVVFSALVALGLYVVDNGASAVAIHYAASTQPSAGSTVTRQTFEPWSNDVSRGTFRVTGGSGPAWVVELTAPGDESWHHYSAVVVISAVTGEQEAGSVVASN